MEETYKKLFNEFLSSAIDEEIKGRYNSAISNLLQGINHIVLFDDLPKEQKDCQFSPRS